MYHIEDPDEMTPGERFREVALLQRMTVNELHERYRKVFGEDSPSRNKQFLRKRIVWRIQALEERGLSERARKRAMELAKEAEIRIRPPRPSEQRASQIPNAQRFVRIRLLTTAGFPSRGLSSRGNTEGRRSA